MEPGHLHDICSAVHPMVLASPFFREFGLSRRIRLEVPEVSYGSPLDGGRAALAYRSLDRTAAGLGRDGAAFRNLMAPLVNRVDGITDLTLNQLLRVPRDPVAAGLFGLRTLEQGSRLWVRRFREDLAPALLTGVAAHAVSPLPALAAAGAGLMLGALAHAEGWPVPLGGSAAIAEALIADLEAHGGVVKPRRGSTPWRSCLRSGPPCWTLPRPHCSGWRTAGSRTATGGPWSHSASETPPARSTFILSGPVPWAAPDSPTPARSTSAAPGKRWPRPRTWWPRAGIRSGPMCWSPSRHASTLPRAPEGRHILWSYCHVPAGSTVDMGEAVITQLERFAPGFRDVIVRYKVTTAAALADYNPNYVGGDYSAGLMDLRGVIQRPVLGPVPWRTPLPGVYLCSSSTPPGPGVTGMSGFHAAKYALKDIFGLAVPPLGI